MPSFQVCHLSKERPDTLCQYKADPANREVALTKVREEVQCACAEMRSTSFIQSQMFSIFFPKNKEIALAVSLVEKICT